MDDASPSAKLKELPSIDELLRRPSIHALLAGKTHASQVSILRRAVDAARRRLKQGSDAPFCEGDVETALRDHDAYLLGPVHNATGVVLHTNLGRAPLAKEAIAHVVEVARGYCNLELDLEEGGRGSRDAPVTDLLRALTGAEDAVVVNNNAAAVLLVLAALGQGRSAIVSRGELVEIGGGFRIPDVMRQSGVRLVEVGTTNRTHLSDYEAAIADDTALLLKVHRSNFAQVGFTEEVTTRALAELAQRRGLQLFEDLGSGLLQPLHGEGIPAEPTVAQVVKAGADVVAFSGDKLLGGPQAGIVVGRAQAVGAIRRHPLCRALRVDKLTTAALEATLAIYRDGRLDALPTHALLLQPEEQLRARAERLASLLAGQGVRCTVVEVEGQVGGGAMPLARLLSYGCAVQHRDTNLLHGKLRGSRPPVVARIADDALLLDVRCLNEEALQPVAVAVGSAIKELAC